MQILYSGLLRSPASWARVGRSILESLNRLGTSAAAVPMRGFLYDEGFPLPKGVEEVARRNFPADIELTFAHPCLYHKLRGPRRAGILVYEGDRLPEAWVEPIRKELDLLFVPSKFCRQGALKAGVPSHRVRLLPFGVDHRVFTRSRKEPSVPFTFFSVCAPHKRKGLVELLDAYRSVFTSHDRVQLVIKTTYDPGRRRRNFHWETPPLEELLEAAHLNDQEAPTVLIKTGTIDDEELAGLYNKAHVYVQPSYGEAFGLAPLEAAACGCAVCITGWGGTTEIFSRDDAYYVDYTLVGSAPYEYDRNSGGLMAKPKQAGLALALQKLKQDTPLFTTLRRNAQRRAARFSWNRTAEHLISCLHELLKQKPRHSPTENR